MINRSKSTKQQIWVALNIATVVGCVALVYASLRYGGKHFSKKWKTGEFQAVQEKLTDENCIPICVSRDCIWHANMLLRNMNLTADICENARSFLCGGFEQKFSSDEKRDVLDESSKQTVIKLKDVLQNVQAKPGSASEKMKIVYDSCINYGSSEFQGIKDLKEMFNNLGLINWPNLVQDFNFSDISLPMIFGNFTVYSGNEYIHLSHVALKDNESGTDRFPVFSLSFLFKLSTKIPKEMALRLLKYFDLESEDIDRIINDHELVRNSIVDLYESIEKCIEDCSEIQINCSRQNDDEWRYICKTTDVILNLMNYDDRISAYTLTIEHPEEVFYKNLFPVLNSLPDRTVANFLALDFIQRYQEDLNFYFRFLKSKYIDLFQPRDVESIEMDKWKFCTQWIVNNLGYPLVNEVLHQYLTRTVIEEIVDFFHEYSSILIDIIEFQEWLPSEIKLELGEWIKNLPFNMDSIRQILPNETHANEVFKKFHPTSESFFKNVLKLKRSVFQSKSSISPLYNEPRDLLLPGFDINAYSSDDVHFDFGFFFPPFYIPGHTRLMNFAWLTHTFGHEFGHAINLFLDLNADKVPQSFLSRKQCFIDQASKFKFEYLNVNLNGSQYVKENLADNVAAALINKVIQKHSSNDLILPGLPYSTKQLLYIVDRQMWCSKSNLKQDTLRFTYSAHPPNGYRLLANIRNSRGFSEAFQCPEGSFVNPETKCSLFDIN